MALASNGRWNNIPALAGDHLKEPPLHGCPVTDTMLTALSSVAPPPFVRYQKLIIRSSLFDRGRG
jgi:hypothetical protein